MDYINADTDGLTALTAALPEDNRAQLIEYNVGAADDNVKKVATDAATKAKVTKLPSFYVVTDDTVDPKYADGYDQFKDETVGKALNAKLVTWLTT